MGCLLSFRETPGEQAPDQRHIRPAKRFRSENLDKDHHEKDHHELISPWAPPWSAQKNVSGVQYTVENDQHEQQERNQTECLPY